MKILIADDDAGIRAILKRVAGQIADVVLEADSGLALLAQIERNDPDLLVTDLRMPAIDGFAAIAAIRESTAHRRMPIICLSASSDRGDVERLNEFGISDYLLKPMKPADLIDRIRRVWRRESNWRDEAESTPATPRSTNAAGCSAIIVVDPNPSFRGMLREALAGRCTVVEASTAIEGLEAYAGLAANPTAVLVAADLSMPRPERLVAMLGELAAHAGRPVPPVILLSEIANAKEDSPSAFAGAVPRSFSASAFVASIERWLAGPERRSANAAA